MKKQSVVRLSVATAICFCAAHLNAAVVIVGFEDVFPGAPGGVAPLSTLTGGGYTESGYFFAPSGSADNASIVDSADATNMTGNDDSDFLVLQDPTSVTVTRTDGAAFSVDRLLYGPATGSGATAMDVLVITGTPSGGGGPLVTNLPIVLTATASPVASMTDVVSVIFSSSGTVALDNVQFSTVPEPGCLTLVAFGAVLFAHDGIAADRARLAVFRA